MTLRTPRTQAAQVSMLRLDGDIDEVVAATFARQLERELIAAQSATAALPVEEGAIQMLRAVRDFLADDQHSKWRYVESGEQNEDMAEWIGKMDALLDRHRMKGEPDRPDWAQQLPGAEIFDRAARYEYIRTLNPREFAALYDEALHGDRFDDLVDRYRDAGGRQE